MIDEKYIELINKEIDGEITSIEQERLNRYYSVNPEARKFHDELRQTSELLSEIPMVEPSPNIKKYVMNSIDLNRYSKATKPGKLESVISNLLVKPSPKLAYAFALGILVGILVYSALFENMISKRGMNVTDFYGTIRIDEQSGFRTVKEIPITLPEINGVISVQRLANIVVLEIDVRTLKEMEIQFEYDASHLKFSHFSSGSQSKISFVFRESYVQASFCGDIQFILFFTKIAAEDRTIRLKLFLAGDLCYTQNILL